MPTLWSSVDGRNWYAEVFQVPAHMSGSKYPGEYRDAAIERAHAICSTQCDVGTVDTIVLLENKGMVEEFFVTFVDDTDMEPWYSHRECDPIPIVEAKELGFMLEASNIVGNFGEEL